MALGTAAALLSQLTWASTNFVQAHAVLLLYTSHLAATKQLLAIRVATTLLSQLAWASANFVHGHAALLLHALHLTAAKKSLALGVATTLLGPLPGASTGLVHGHAALFLNTLHLAAAKKSLALGVAAALGLLIWASANALLRYALLLADTNASRRGIFDEALHVITAWLSMGPPHPKSPLAGCTFIRLALAWPASPK